MLHSNFNNKHCLLLSKIMIIIIIISHHLIDWSLKPKNLFQISYSIHSIKNQSHNIRNPKSNNSNNKKKKKKLIYSMTMFMTLIPSSYSKLMNFSSLFKPISLPNTLKEIPLLNSPENNCQSHSKKMKSWILLRKI